MAKKVPAPPEGLNEAAAGRWRTVAPTLPQKVDKELLGTYCKVWARWKQAEDGIAQTGQLVKSATGRAVASPLIAIAKDAGATVRALEKRLGIGTTPVPADDADDVVTRRQLADRLSVHMQTITKWEREGLPIEQRGRKGKPSTYRESAVRAWVAAREQAANKTGLVDVAQERARKERAQAELTEQTYLQRARKLLPADEVARVWGAEITAVRAIILSSYTTHADRVFRAATLEGLPGVEAALKDLAYQILRELADPNRHIEKAS